MVTDKAKQVLKNLTTQVTSGDKNGDHTNGINDVSKKREETAKRIIAAVHETKGLLTLAAKRTGLGYTTIQRYVSEFPTVKQAVIEAKEQMIDFAESKLYQKINSGDAIAILFYLKCQAKHRGYIERHEITGGDGAAILLRVVYESPISPPSELKDANST